MDEILIACGDVDLLKRIAGDLPGETYKPVATRTAEGIAAKLQGRGVGVAIVHSDLQDGRGLDLCRELKALDPAPRIVFLADSPPDDGPFDRALAYPVPGPVLRNAVEAIDPSESDELDLDKWKAFYREVDERLAATDDQNYYEMLGLEPDSPHHAVIEAFDRLSLRYHPDRYTQFRDRKWGRALHEKVTALYTVLTEAHEVLGDRKLRKRYEQLRRNGEKRMPPDELSSPESGPTSLSEAANSAKTRRFLEMAQTEIAKENWESALQNLEFAQSVEPDNERIAHEIEKVEAKLE